MLVRPPSFRALGPKRYLRTTLLAKPQHGLLILCYFEMNKLPPFGGGVAYHKRRLVEDLLRLPPLPPFGFKQGSAAEMKQISKACCCKDEETLLLL
jgi:hypothetical protein